MKESGWFLTANRNKRSITVNLASAEGQALVRDLAGKSDVLIENYKVGDLARFGLGYATLHELFPKLVYCSVTGFGQTGPYAKLPGVDTVFQAIGGLMSLTGEENGPPLRVGVSMGDYVGALYSAFAIMSALYHRDLHGGTGQHIDLSLLDATVAAASHKAQDFLVSGEVPGRFGSAVSDTAIAQALRCKDGSLMVQASTDEKFLTLCTVGGRPDIARDPLYALRPIRIRNKASLVDLLEREIMGQYTVAEWMERLNKVGIICSAVNDLRQTFDDPQVRHRGMAVEVPHPFAGLLKLVANPLRFSETPIEGYTAPPQIGEHTDAVLKDVLGIDAGEINRLRQTGAI
jgi:crotonobetainyl-CoA:carnitine CoA-transferase CaiB-like acyl-CoA transferase